MKTKLPFLTAASLVFLAVGVTPTFAKGKATPAPETTASTSSTATAKPARAIAFHGKVASVDTSAKTFVVGKRTFKVTDETKITKDDAAATMSDIAADLAVRGSFWKRPGGALEAKMVKLGAKTEAKKMSKKEGTASDEATPKP